MARTKSKRRIPDLVFLQHETQVKKILKKQQKKINEHNYFFNINFGNIYYYKVKNNIFSEKYTYKTENINLSKLLSDLGYIEANSDRLYVPDISLRLKEKVNKFSKLVSNHPNIKNKSIKPELNQEKTHKEKIIQDLSTQLSDVNVIDENLTSILNEFLKLIKDLKDKFSYEIDLYFSEILTKIHTIKEEKIDVARFLKLNICLYNKENSKSNTYKIFIKDIPLKELNIDHPQIKKVQINLEKYIKHIMNLKYLRIKKLNFDGIIFDEYLTNHILNDLSNNIDLAKIKSQKFFIKQKNIDFFTKIKMILSKMNLIYITGNNSNSFYKLYSNVIYPSLGVILHNKALHKINIDYIEFNEDLIYENMILLDSQYLVINYQAIKKII